MTDGTPINYSRYLRIPELLDQQHPQIDPPAHDEMQFIIVHQVYELWFKLLLHELDMVKASILAGTDGDLRTATRLSKRVEAILKVLVGQIHVLETMRPHEFLAFRYELNPASGFQSVQFREVECLLGLKSDELVKRAAGDPRIDALRRRLAEPSIPDVVYDLLRQREFDVTVPGPARTTEQRKSTLTALQTVYQQPDDHDTLYGLLESLVDIDEQIVLWRRHHVMMVERQIGAKRGTGAGTTGEKDGIRYLRETLDKRALPDLWAVRTILVREEEPLDEAGS